ncbi:MAG: choice-of-anchor J domain-containing protein [Cytophagaceae bacterium]|jgi:archaellum component FlaF (FlaF/FlaG flagellin family)|nr:choice-of-anchor J domain-containing protein [Cytophagaceae bacterium]
MDKTFRNAGKQQPKQRVNIETRKSGKKGVATITVKVVGDPWENGTGVQMILDSDCVIYDEYQLGFSGWDDMYGKCEYTIPENITPDPASASVVIDGSLSVDIPGGAYDFVVVRPTGSDILMLVWGELYPNQIIRAFIDNYTFQEGYEYLFTVENGYSSTVEFNAEYDATLTNLAIPAASPDLTAQEAITVTLLNNGFQNCSGMSLSYSINDGAVVTETFAAVLPPGVSTPYTFAAKADLSAGGLYKIEAWVDYTRDMSPWRNRITGYTANRSPMALPFKDNFDDRASLALWTVIDNDGDGFNWEYESMLPDEHGGEGSMRGETSWAGGGAADDYLITNAIIIPKAGTYNLSFFSYPLGVGYGETESLEIMYGASPNPEEMTLLQDYQWTDWNWKLNFKDFEIETPGNYYFAFHYNTNPTQVFGTLLIDKVWIREGAYQSSPDMRFSTLFVPVPACEIINDYVGAEVFNNGLAPIEEFTLTYQVGDGTPVSQTFQQHIGIRESVIVDFDQTVNIAQMGDHTVKFTAATPGEQDDYLVDNEAEAIVHVVAPITELPFVRDFDFATQRSDWYPAFQGQWILNTQGQGYYYWAVTENVPFLSRCVTLEPEVYRFKYTYTSGYMTATDDFYVAFGKQGTDPMSWPAVNTHTESYTADVQTEDFFTFEVSEPGEYVFAIVPTRLGGTLRIFGASLGVVPEHDIEFRGITSPLSFPHITPKHQTKGAKKFTTAIQNMGQTGAESGKIDILHNGDIIGTQNVSFTDMEEVASVAVEAVFNEIPVGNATVTFNVSNENGVNRSVDVLKIVSDSTFAWDRCGNEYLGGFGLNGGTARFGLLYELQNKDVLTTLTLGLFDETNTYEERDFEFAVYAMADNSTLGEMLFETTFTRPQGSNYMPFTFDVPDTELLPGTYLFEIRQLTSKNIGIVCDNTLDGVIYDTTDGTLIPIEGLGLGTILLRPNLGKMGSVGISQERLSENSLTLYPNPSNGTLSVTQKGVTIERITVFDASGKMLLKKEINSNTGTLNTEQFAKGIYFITVQSQAGIVSSKFTVL